MTGIVGFECEHDQDDALASRILRILVDSYPGYAWFVLIRGGVIQVKNLDWSPTWGMALHYTQVMHDAAVLKKSVIKSAGEFLERANVARGRMRDDERMQRIEGVPDKALAGALQ